MRVWSPSLKGSSPAGKAFYAAVLLLMLTSIAYGLLFGAVYLSVTALILAVPFMFSAPFVLGGRWRKPPPRPTRRPVVRRRRY